MRKYSNGKDLNEKILSGVNKLADNVASTMGPNGRNVIIRTNKDTTPIITKDGVTVSRAISFEDEFEDAAAQIIKQAAERTNTVAGDGTTSSTVLARALFREAQKYLITDVSPVEIKRGMDIGCEMLVGQLKASAKQIRTLQDIKDIASISANNDKLIGDIIGEAVDLIGKDGAITVKESREPRTTLTTEEGFRIKGGYVSQHFCNDAKFNLVKYEKPYILVVDDTLEGKQQVMKALELVANADKPLVIFSYEVKENSEILAALIANAIRGSLKIAAVKVPGYGEERKNNLEDIAIATGATLLGSLRKKSLEEITLKDFGEADLIEINKNFTTIMSGKCDVEKLSEAVEKLKKDIEIEDDMIICERIQERITRLTSGVAVINVGGTTEIEAIETKHRIEDALEAVKSAQEEGIVPGGGCALLFARKTLLDNELEDEDTEGKTIGRNIVFKVCEEPLRQMSLNAGESPDIILSKIDYEDKKGYNLAKQAVVDMIEDGVIDPVKVTRVALQNAVSVAGTLITTKYAVVEV